MAEIPRSDLLMMASTSTLKSLIAQLTDTINQGVIDDDLIERHWKSVQEMQRELKRRERTRP
jgi:hypothetical protein